MTVATKIEWADSTFNPWIGCTKISPACDHCYAEAQMDTRMGRVQWGAGKARSRTSPAYWKQPLRWNARADEFRQCDVCGWRGERQRNWAVCPTCKNGLMQLTRRRVFCASLADVFDNEVDPVWRADLISLIGMTPDLDWLLLTKRIGNAAAMLKEAKDYWAFSDRPGKDWKNIWLGATICNREEMLRDAPKLRATLAAMHFWSIEPMLEDLGEIPRKLLPDWVIAGGESGPHARPMNADWAGSLRDQCKVAGVPFFMKQMGGARDKRGSLEALPDCLRIRELPHGN